MRSAQCLAQQNFKEHFFVAYERKSCAAYSYCSDCKSGYFLPISIDKMFKSIDASRTVLLLGAGASIPSGGPSVSKLITVLSSSLEDDLSAFSLAEACTIYEKHKGRAALIEIVRGEFRSLRLTGGLSSISRFPWKSIYTTNYDNLVEDSFRSAGATLNVFSSNFDFGTPTKGNTLSLFKLHGSIDKDIVDGHRSRMILTLDDYEHALDFREKLFDRFSSDLNESNLLVIGNSLGDDDIKILLDRASSIQSASYGRNSFSIMSYAVDENRALLYERKGFQVAFGDVDEAFRNLHVMHPTIASSVENPDTILHHEPLLQSTTTDVTEAAKFGESNFALMYAGGAATYQDITSGFTFQRTSKSEIVKNVTNDGAKKVLILGNSGVGKTTLCRQVMLGLVDSGYQCWEHRRDCPLFVDQWVAIAKKLKEKGKNGFLLIDDCHFLLAEINELSDRLASLENDSLGLLLCSSPNRWNMRVKSPTLFINHKQRSLSKLDSGEVERLLNLIEDVDRIRALVDPSFRGFTRAERRRRLEVRCSKNFFVCLKNIFANDSFDNIILNEFNELPEKDKEIYRYICALESLGAKIHRQFVVRLLGISSDRIGAALEALEGLIVEYDIDQRYHIYGWRGRHPVISEVVSRYKFSDSKEIFSLLKQVVSGINPSYDVEIRTLRQICSFNSGLGSLTSKSEQNELLRMMISVAPNERVPRHRLIANLIRQGQFPDADAEIRVFENDLGLDGPVRRHRIRLSLERVSSQTDMVVEDRLATLRNTLTSTETLIGRSGNNLQNMTLYCDVVLDLFKSLDNLEVVEEARDKLKQAERDVGDPELTRLIARFERRIADLSLVP